MTFDNEYNEIVDEIIIFRDDLNYNLDDIIIFFKNICDKEIIETIYKNNGSQYINNRFNGHWCLKDDNNNNSYIACV